MRVLGLLLLTVLLIGGTLRLWGTHTEAGQIDACLDRGGAWSYEQSKCLLESSAP